MAIGEGRGKRGQNKQKLLAGYDENRNQFYDNGGLLDPRTTAANEYMRERGFRVVATAAGNELYQHGQLIARWQTREELQEQLARLYAGDDEVEAKTNGHYESGVAGIYWDATNGYWRVTLGKTATTFREDELDLARAMRQEFEAAPDTVDALREKYARLKAGRRGKSHPDQPAEASPAEISGASTLSGLISAAEDADRQYQAAADEAERLRLAALRAWRAVFKAAASSTAQAALRQMQDEGGAG